MTANRSYKTLNLCLIKCLKIGINPNIHSDMYNSVKTFDVFFSLLDKRIDPKKIALMLVGVPKNIIFCFGSLNSLCFLTTFFDFSLVYRP